MLNPQSTHLMNLDNLISPQLSNKKKTSELSISASYYFGLAFGLLMLSAPMIGWIEEKSIIISSALCLGGICQFILGLYNFYKHRKIQNIFDSIFGLLIFLFFFTYDLGMFKIKVLVYHNYSKGIFYCFWLVVLLITFITLKDRGILFVINTFFIASACVFVIIYEFWKKKLVRKIAGYIIFITCATIWLIAMIKLINEMSGKSFIPFIIPKI